MKIKKKLQNLFKNFFYFIFKKMYGEVVYDIFSLKNNIKIKINLTTLKNFFNDPYKIYKIKSGRIWLF